MKRTRVSVSFLLVLLLIFIAAGCSNPGGVNPVTPSEPSENQAAIEGPGTELGEGSLHHPMGFFECTADPAAGTLDIVPVRIAEQHINAVYFLQGGPEQFLTIEGAPKFSDSGKTLDVDIAIKHPMVNPIFTGFDVRAILISEGSQAGWADSTIKLAGPNETRLVNADGYTRWWNPKEFLNGGIYGYLPGFLGTQILPGSAAILNGFKYYADCLGPDDDFSSLDPGTRGMFTAGAKNVRHFTISLKGGLKFNYAVDASWAFPTKMPPEIPGDFPAQANEFEPYRIEVNEWVNTLWYDGTEHGGNIFMLITAYDWQGLQTIGGGFLEIPNLGIENALNDIYETGDNFVTWAFRAYDPKIKKAGPADMLITVYSPQGDYQPLQTGVNKFFRAYALQVTDVYDGNPGPVPPVAIAEATTSTNIAKHQSVTFYAGDSYDPDGVDVTYEWDFNGDGVYGDAFDSGTAENPTYIFDPGGVFEVDVKAIDADLLEDTLDQKITVNVSNEAPTAVAHMSGQDPYWGNAWYTFDASDSTDPDGVVSEWAWDFDYDGVTFTPDEYGETVIHAFDLGTHSVMLCVWDDDGATDYIDEPITHTFVFKENTPPEVTGIEVDRSTVLKNSDDERLIITVTWNDIDSEDTQHVEWIADGGEFEVLDDQQFEQTVAWKAIDEVGHFYVTARVYDLFNTYDEATTPMIRVTKYPTGQDPWNYNVSVAAPPWSMVTIPDQLPMDSGPYIPGKVNFMLFLRYC